MCIIARPDPGLGVVGSDLTLVSCDLGLLTLGSARHEG